MCPNSPRCRGLLESSPTPDYLPELIELRGRCCSGCFPAHETRFALIGCRYRVYAPQPASLPGRVDHSDAMGPVEKQRTTAEMECLSLQRSPLPDRYTLKNPN